MIKGKKGLILNAKDSFEIPKNQTFDIEITRIIQQDKYLAIKAVVNGKKFQSIITRTTEEMKEENIKKHLIEHYLDSIEQENLVDSPSFISIAGKKIKVEK